MGCDHSRSHSGCKEAQKYFLLTLNSEDVEVTGILLRVGSYSFVQAGCFTVVDGRFREGYGGLCRDMVLLLLFLALVTFVPRWCCYRHHICVDILALGCLFDPLLPLL